MIKNIREGIPVVIEVIKKTLQNDRVIDVIPVNKRRHYLLKTKKGMAYYYLYKRKFFMSFGKIFNFKGIGDSVNEEYMDFARTVKADAFIFLYPKGDVYIAPIQEAYDFARRNDTIRVTKSNEMTYSFPVRMLRSWE